MLQFLPLPILWLSLYALGRLVDARSLASRRYIVVALSSLFLFLAAGPQTFIFYSGLGLGILLCGHLLRGVRGTPARGVLFAASIAAMGLMIALFLIKRNYIQKYFIYLPSLSYLGFRGIAYLTSVYRRQDVDFSAGLMQMLFFPMLFIGPISRVENFEEEHWDYQDVLRRIAMGLSMLVAGHVCGYLVLDELRRPHQIPVGSLWLSALANSFELYFTFAGYTHLIIGLGLLVGFKLPENFNNPYISTSITDFWRRWHMSLSYWVRDYVYIPLGGNRKGLARKCLNLLTAMSLIGVWHGLTLNYFVWGLFHGALLCIENLMAHYRLEPLSKLPAWLVLSIRTTLTFGLVTFGWLLFKYSISDVFIVVRRMFGC